MYTYVCMNTYVAENKISTLRIPQQKSNSYFSILTVAVPQSSPLLSSYTAYHENDKKYETCER